MHLLARLREKYYSLEEQISTARRIISLVRMSLQELFATNGHQAGLMGRRAASDKTELPTLITVTLHPTSITIWIYCKNIATIQNILAGMFVITVISTNGRNLWRCNDDYDV